MTDYQNRLARMGTRGKLVEFCPKCGKRYVGDESKAGTRVKCLKLTCGHTFVLPGHRTTGPSPRPRPKPKTSALKTVLVSLISLLTIGSIVLGTVLLIKKNKTGPTPKKIVKPVGPGPGPEPDGALAKLPIKQMVCRVVPGLKIVGGGQTIERWYDWYNNPTPLELRSLSPWERKHILQTYKDGSMAMQTPPIHGSGFLITSDGYIITNQHVVEYTKALIDNPSYLRRFQVHEGYTSIKPQIYVLFDGKSYAADLVHVSKNYDMAVLKASNFPGGTPFKLSASNDVPLISDIWVLGFPGEAEEALPGSAEALKRRKRSVDHKLIKEAFDPNQLTLNRNKGAIGKIKIDDTIGRIIQYDCQAAGGNSGGPAVTPDGIVRGIHTWGMNAQRDKDGKLRVTRTKVNAAGLLLPMRGEIDAAVGASKVQWVDNPDKK